VVGAADGHGVGRYGEAKLIEAVEAAKATVLDALCSDCVEDLAFIGNASTVYPWEPAMIIDLDVCMFVTHMDETTGRWLQAFANSLEALMENRGIDFELRIIRGPYKPVREDVIRPAMVLHGAVFTEKTYLEEAALMRWGWRKYQCEVDAERLVRLAPQKPNLETLLHGPKGVNERLAAIRKGLIVLQERLLPSLEFVDITFDVDHPLFAEYCLTAGATTARNHARVLGRMEADRLTNQEFFPWYFSNVFASLDLAELVRLKAGVRQTGYKNLMPRVRELAWNYLESLGGSLSEQRSL